MASFFPSKRLIPNAINYSLICLPRWLIAKIHYNKSLQQTCTVDNGDLYRKFKPAAYLQSNTDKNSLSLSLGEWIQRQTWRMKSDTGCRCHTSNKEAHMCAIKVQWRSSHVMLPLSKHIINHAGVLFYRLALQKQLKLQRLLRQTQSLASLCLAGSIQTSANTKRKTDAFITLV